MKSLAQPVTRARLGTALLLYACSTAQVALATDYSVEGTIDANYSHNDNLRMSEQNKLSVSKYQLLPVIAFKSSTENTDVALTSTFYFNRFSDSDFNSNDQTFDLRVQHNFEKSSLSIEAQAIRQTTLTSEELGSGRVGQSAKRTELYQFSPSWTFFLGENDSVQFSGTYAEQHYSDPTYTGYKNGVADVDWIHVLTERLKGILSVSYSRFQSDDINFVVPTFDTGFIETASGNEVVRGYYGEQGYSTQTKEKKLQLGLDYQWSEASLLQARYGRSNSETTHPLSGDDAFCTNPAYLYVSAVYALQGISVGGICETRKTDDRLTTAEVTWNWHNENQQVQFDATKSTQPSSNGYVVDALVLRSYWAYSLTELDQVSASLTAVRNRSINNEDSVLNNSIADRDYESLSLNYRRRLNEHWSATVGGQYNRQKYNESNLEASAKVFSIGIRYQPQSQHWAR